MQPFDTDKKITAQLLPLAQLITTLHFEKHPSLEEKYGATGRQKCTEDAQYHLSYLEQAVKSESKTIFTNYLTWVQSMLQSRNIPMQDLMDNLDCMDIACSRLLSVADYGVVTGYIREGIQILSNGAPKPASCLHDDNPLLAEAKQYMGMLLDGRRKEAQALIAALVKNGHSVADVYEYIFQATQHEVGLLWQTNQITVAHEHYCTAATQLIMATLYPYIFDAVRKGRTLVACTISGDLHELGIRMVSDLFEMDGWDTYYLGANMPHANILSAIKDQGADVLAISVTMPFHVSRTESLIRKIRQENEMQSMRIIVGGYPFILVPDLWSRIGADGSAATAKEAIQLANHLISDK